MSHLIVTHPEHSVVVFFKRDGSAEAVVTATRNIRPTRVLFPPPPEGKQISVERWPNGSVEVKYADD